MKILVDATGGYEDWWPLGRKLLPVQFYKIDGESTFERTLKNVLKISRDLFVLCDEFNKFYAYEILEKHGFSDYEDRVLFDTDKIKDENFLVFPSTLVDFDPEPLKDLNEGDAVFTDSNLPKPGVLHIDLKTKDVAIPKNSKESKELLERGYKVFSGIFYGKPDCKIENLEAVYIPNIKKLDSFLDISYFDLAERLHGEKSRDSVVFTEREVYMDGIEDAVVIDLEDVLFISSYEKFSGKSKFYEKVKDKELANVHKTAYRPWGSYTVLEEGEGFKVKRITVKPGKRLSLQLHYHRSEHWTVVKGSAIVTVGDKRMLVRPGEHVFIPAGEKHRLENPGKIPLEVIEVQVGEYLGEDDIVRIEDDFKRV